MSLRSSHHVGDDAMSHALVGESRRFRNDLRGDSVLTTDVWFEQSIDDGSTWREIHVAGPFDLRAVGPRAISNFIDLTDTASGFDAVYALGSPLTTKPPPVQGAIDIYRAHIN